MIDDCNDDVCFWILSSKSDAADLEDTIYTFELYFS